MHAKTTVALSSSFDQDRLWLNGTEESVESNPRLINCLREVRRRATKNAVCSLKYFMRHFQQFSRDKKFSTCIFIS